MSVQKVRMDTTTSSKEWKILHKDLVQCNSCDGGCGISGRCYILKNYRTWKKYRKHQWK